MWRLLNEENLNQLYFLLIAFISYKSIFWQLRFFDGLRPYSQLYRRNDRSLSWPYKSLEMPMKSVRMWTVDIPLFAIISFDFMTGRDGLESVAKYLIGESLALFLCLSTKYISGRPRPHFLSANGIKYDSTDNEIFRVSFDKLEKTELVRLRESTRSLFSGHALLGSYAAVFLMVHFYQFTTKLNIITAIFTMALITCGVWPGLTQVRSRWHFWSDVIAGWLVGTVSAATSRLLLEV